MAQADREFKSNVFASYFQEDTNRLISMYNALADKAYPKDTTVQLTTLEDALFKSAYNDIAFILNEQLIVLDEHQSSINPNMPFRFLQYLARIYAKIYPQAEMFYGKKLYKIHAVECFVLYNGDEKLSDKSILKLSDAFPEGIKSDLELTVKVFNINDGHNSAIMSKCDSLREYSKFIGKVKAYRALGMELQQAIQKAVNDSIDEGIMADYLTRNSTEVRDMLYHEFKIDDIIRVQRLEASADERAKAEKKENDAIISLLRLKTPIDSIKVAFGYSVDRIRELEKFV